MAVTYNSSELLKTLEQLQQEFYKHKIYQEELKLNTTATEVFIKSNYWIQKPARKENIRYLNKPEVRNDKT